MFNCKSSILVACAFAFVLSACEGGGIGMVGSPAWMATTTPAEKQSYISGAYKKIQDTNLTAMEAFTFCRKNSSSAGAIARMQAQASIDSQPKTYSTTGTIIGNTLYTTTQPVSPGPAASFAQGLSVGIAGGLARRAATRNCMLALGYLETD